MIWNVCSYYKAYGNCYCQNPQGSKTSDALCFYSHALTCLGQSLLLLYLQWKCTKLCNKTREACSCTNRRWKWTTARRMPVEFTAFSGDLQGVRGWIGILFQKKYSSSLGEGRLPCGMASGLARAVSNVSLPS